MTDEQWEKRAKRVFNAPFDPWQVLDAFQGWFEVQMGRKDLKALVKVDALTLTDGTIYPATRAEAIRRIREDHLSPRGYWEIHSGFDVMLAIETGLRVRIRCSLWWDFSDNELLVITNGPDRDEVIGFGARVQEWLDAATPETKQPERVAHYTIKPPAMDGPARLEEPEPRRLSKAVWGWVLGIAGAVAAGGILHVLGWV